MHTWPPSHTASNNNNNVNGVGGSNHNQSTSAAMSSSSALRPRTPHALGANHPNKTSSTHSHQLRTHQEGPRLARLNSTTVSSGVGSASQSQALPQDIPPANKRIDSGHGSHTNHSSSHVESADQQQQHQAASSYGSNGTNYTSSIMSFSNSNTQLRGGGNYASSTFKPQQSHYPSVDYHHSHHQQRDHAADMSFLIHPADMTLSSIQLPNHTNAASNSNGSGGIQRSRTPVFVSSRAPGQHTTGSLLTPMPPMPNLEDVWSTVSMIQSEILDDDMEHVAFGSGGGASGEHGLLPSSSYVVSVAHEVLVRPEETSMEICFADLGRHVSRLVKMQDLILALLEYNASKGRTSADASPLAIESIADKLLAVINEILYTTRPQAATRVRYMRAELATDRPFAVFTMFAKLAEKFDEQRTSVLLAKLPFSLAEWVQLRNQVVVITERVRCAQEIHL